MIRREPEPSLAARAAARPWRVLAVAPVDAAGPLLEAAAEAPLMAWARAAGGRVAWTVVADADGAAHLRRLPPSARLVVAPPWRVVPRDRVAALRPGARAQAGLACVAELLAAVAPGPGAPPWDCVHGFDVAGALPAAALARAFGLPWVWSPPAWAHDPDAAGPAARPDEHALWCAGWAAAVADLIVVADAAQLADVRRAWAPPQERLALVPFGALAGWEEPAAPVEAAAMPPRPPRVALLLGRGAGGDEVAAALAGLARRRIAVSAAGLRHAPAALALRREARRLGLAAGLVWRDLGPGVPLPDPAAELGRPRAALVLGGEAPPPALLATLGRAGVAVGSAIEGAASDPEDDADPDASADAVRAAWRRSVAPQAAAPEEVGRRLAAAYARAVGAARGHAAAGTAQT